MRKKDNKVSKGAEGKAWYQAIGSKLWYLFNSLKLTLFVLITLAIVSIFGTVIEQNLPAEDYVARYGEKWARVIFYLHLNDLFHSFTFQALLAALALNIIVCTFERFPPKWKALLNHRSEKFDPNIVDRFSNSETVSLKVPAETAKGRVLKAFARKKFKTMTFSSGSDQLVYAWKGIIGRFGSDVTHISLLLILLGAIVGSVAGYKDYRAVYEGGTIKIPKADFKLRLDKFWIDYYDSGQIKQYNSLLTVMENGKEVLHKQIWVNEPLYFKGIRFYQSSYGVAWDRVNDAGIAIKKKGESDPQAPVTVKWEQLVKMPNSKYSVKLVGYTADFAYDEATGTVYSKSPDANNPAVKLEVYEGGKLVSTPWIFLKYPGIFPAIPNSDTDLVLEGYHGEMYSGISINRDPGTNIVWLGAAVMGIGFILAFFVYHRRVWVRIRGNGKSTEVKIGGMINKNNFVFEREIKEILDSVKSD